MIVGHRKIQERLKRAVEKDRVAHAYLFYGPESVGKMAVAKEFAGRLIGSTGFAGASEDRDPVDLLVLRPEREEEKGVMREKDISVEEVREMQKQLALFPFAGKRRVLIVDDAHKLTEAAQNALLKTLEEPQSHSILILVTHEPGKILPTILSRCQRAAFRLVPAEDMRALAQELPTSLPAEATFLFSLGRPGLPKRFFQDAQAFAFSQEMLQSFFRLPQLTLNDRLGLAEKLAGQPAQTVRILAWWLSGLHGRAAESKGERVALFRGMEKIENTLRLLKKSSASNRLVLEDLLVNWEDN
jgi:DNA polymerase-3 subunit delta'